MQPLFEIFTNKSGSILRNMSKYIAPLSLKNADFIVPYKNSQPSHFIYVCLLYSVPFCQYFNLFIDL